MNNVTTEIYEYEGTPIYYVVVQGKKLASCCDAEAQEVLVRALRGYELQGDQSRQYQVVENAGCLAEVRCVISGKEEVMCVCQVPERAQIIARALEQRSSFKTLRVMRDEAESMIDLLEKQPGSWGPGIASELRMTFGMPQRSE